MFFVYFDLLILPFVKYFESLSKYAFTAYVGITNDARVFIFNYAPQPLRLIVRSGLDVPTFATRCLHACHHAREPSGGRWYFGREMSGNFT